MSEVVEIPDSWIAEISDDEIKRIASDLVKLGLRIPGIKDKVVELVWLICTEDARESVEGKR